jgi:hypothetical protein
MSVNREEIKRLIDQIQNQDAAEVFERGQNVSWIPGNS